MIPTALPYGTRGRVLAWTIAGIIAALVWALGASPLLDYYNERAQRLNLLRLRVDREMGSVAALPALINADLADRPSPVHQLLTGGTDAVAAASLQERVQAMASAVHARVNSIVTLPSAQIGAYRRIAARFDLTGNLQAVFSLFRAMQEDNLEILVNDAGIKVYSLASTDPQAPLDCTFTVYAFRANSPSALPH